MAQSETGIFRTGNDGSRSRKCVYLSEIADGYFATNPIDTVLSLNQNPPFIYDNTFSETSFANAKVKVPEGTENLYKADPVWSRFKDLESGDGGVTKLDVPSGAAVAIVSADG